MIRDRALIFGRFAGIVGILTEPAAASDGDAPAGLPGIVFINTGIEHRVGSNRMNALWAQHLARAGHCVLRFDLCGIGDSERRTDSLSPVDGALADIRDAVDWLQASRQIDRVILVGLCSGADFSLLYAGDDPRVAGMVLIDPSTPPTRRFYVNYFIRKLFIRDAWKRIFTIRWSEIQARREEGRRTLEPDAWKYGPVPLHNPSVRAITANAYRAALAAGVKILAIFTAGPDFQHNYRRQLLDAFPDVPFGDRLQLEYFERCDHLFALEANRRMLFDVADVWLRETPFKSAPVARESEPVLPPPAPIDPEAQVIIEF
jgi:pimeloyl-ACP methyl ester carboxylesterase